MKYLVLTEPGQAGNVLKLNSRVSHGLSLHPLISCTYPGGEIGQEVTGPLRQLE